MRTYIYADESGNFDFSRNAGATRYFLLTTVVINDHSLESELLELRRELAWDGVELRVGFHAVNDNRYIRRRLFDTLSKHDFRIDATILEKSKAEHHVRSTPAYFYGFAWYHHLTHIADNDNFRPDELLITASSIGTNEMKNNFRRAVETVRNGFFPQTEARTTMLSATSDACLQVADYCSWTIFRKWEHGDEQLYRIIADKIELENDLFGSGENRYY